MILASQVAAFSYEPRLPLLGIHRKLSPPIPLQLIIATFVTSARYNPFCPGGKINKEPCQTNIQTTSEVSDH